MASGRPWRLSAQSRTATGDREYDTHDSLGRSRHFEQPTDYDKSNSPTMSAAVGDAAIPSFIPEIMRNAT